MVYTQTARPGSRAPHGWINESRSTLDLFGRGFVLLRFNPAREVDALVNAAAAQGLPLEVIDLHDEGIAALYERELVLVRPDGFVAWRGDTLLENAADLVATIRGGEPADRAGPDAQPNHPRYAAEA